MALDSGGSRTGIGTLIVRLASELETAKRLVLTLDYSQYNCSEEGHGSIGAHTRHNLNFVECVLKGLETGIVDYTNRDRDKRIETDPAFAAARIDEIISRLKRLDVDPRTALFVASEIEASLLHRSTVSRELEFVLSHTIHHHAIVKEKLKGTQGNFDPGFGVAPSTLEYWRRVGR